jgi:flagellar M-ring protein FliF
MIDNELFIYGGSDGRAISSVQRELERQQEKELEAKARNMLERVYGPGKVVVRVKVDLDFDKRTNMLKEFIPGDTGRGVIRSQQTMEETYTGTGAAPGGAPGTTTNIPGYAISTSNINSDYSKTEATNNYEITTRERNEVLTPGGIRRLTASVIVDGELEEQRINEVKALVSSAIGLNESRGDNLVVQSMKFSTALADALAEQMRQDRLVSLITMSTTGFVLLLLGAILFYLWWKRRKAMLALSRASQETKHIPTIQEMLTSPDMIAAQGEISVLEEQLKAYARSNPKEVANLINEWLSED